MLPTANQKIVYVLSLARQSVRSFGRTEAPAEMHTSELVHTSERVA